MVHNEIEVNMKIYRTAYSIPAYLVQGFGDQGMEYTKDEDIVENNDLRVTIELSAGLHILLDGQCRIIMDKDNIHIQYLCEVNDEE